MPAAGAATGKTRPAMSAGHSSNLERALTMKMSRTVTYAIQATLQIANSGTQEPIPCSQLAAEGEMPERFLLQILRGLVTHNILRSHRGVDGGYSLMRPAEQISLLDLFEAVDGPLDTSLDLNGTVPFGPRNTLQAALRKVAVSAREQLRAIKIAHLVPQRNRGESKAMK